MTADVRLVMTLLLRNNLGFIEHHIRYHQSQGVDFFIVTDNGSTDGTRERLAGYERAGIMHVIDEPEDTYNQNIWVTRMARQAAEKLRPDWVIHCDADEFWIPENGDLKQFFRNVPLNVGAVLCGRKNFLPSMQPAEPFWLQMIYRDVVSLNPSGYPLPGKIAHRPTPAVEVGMGNHTVVNVPGELLKVESPVIFHFPYISYEQFEEKIVLGGAALERNTVLPKEAVYTWREKYALYQSGGLKDWYYSLPHIETHAEKGLAAGTIVRDTRLRDFMQTISPEPVCTPT